MSGWWKLSSTPNGNGYQRLICGMSSGSLHSWDVWRENGSNIGVRSGDGSGNNSSTGYGVAIAAGDTWHYLTVVWEGNKARVYKNGSKVNEQTLRSNTHPNNVFTIGGRVGTSSRSFVGTFDEVRFTAADTTYSSFGEETFVDNAANLSLASNVRIALVKEGDGTFSSTGFSLGTQAYEVDFVQTNGTANHTSASTGTMAFTGCQVGRSRLLVILKSGRTAWASSSSPAAA